MRLTSLLAFLLAVHAFSAPSWHHPLYLGNGGVWHQRLALDIRNATDRPIAGTPETVRIGKAEGQADLVGALAEAVRVCDSAGNEMLFAITSPGGKAVKRGPVPAGSTLTVPVECGAKAAVTYYVYFDNPEAWQVPDFLGGSGQLLNGDLEEGEGDTPTGWVHDANDDQHRTFWVSEAPHSGRKCLKTVVAEGAEETWIATRQGGLRIIGGARYVMTAWVKAENVKGNAGWYIHVGNDQNPMIISPMLDGGPGTYDWKKVTAEFTAPADADRADLGTVLRGTGTAWFDDVTLETTEAKAQVSVTAGRPERLPLREVGAGAPWYTPPGANWPYRVAVRVMNTAPQADDRGLICVDLAGIAGRLQGKADLDSVRVLDGTQVLRSYRLREVLMFEAATPAQTIKTYYLYLREQASAPAAAMGPTPVPALAPGAANPALPGSPAALALGAGPDYAALLDSPRNLAKNPSFELGEALPDDWSGNSEGQRPVGTQMGFDQPGLFGKRCVKMTIPATSTPAWTGWRQDVPVKPGRTYLYAAWVKGQDIKGGLQIHAHRLTATGELTKQDAFAGAGPALEGTSDWTLLSGLFPMPEDAATFQLHLTMLATGTAWHDGVVLAEVSPGETGKLETRMPESVAGLVAWPVNAIVKVFQDDLPPAGVPAARITCARNEREPLQIAVRSPRAVREVAVEVTGPANAAGQVLPPPEIGVVGYVPIDHATNYYSTTIPTWRRMYPTSPGSSDGFPGMWPDPILPHSRFDLPANQTQPVWLTFSVPKGAAPGTYQGTVRLVSRGATLREIPFTLHVWNFELPDVGHCVAIFDTHQSGDMWAIPGMTHQQVRDNMLAFMSERRVCPDAVEPEPAIRYEGGKVIADFSAYDKACERYFDVLHFRHTYTPGCFYLLQWDFPPPEKFGEKPYEGTYPYDQVDRGKLRPEFKRAYQACLKVYWEHMKQKGWADRVALYIGDEPATGDPKIIAQGKALLDMIREVDPTIAIYSSTWSLVPPWYGKLNLHGIGHYGIVSPEAIQERLDAGDRIRYTTDGQMCIDTPYCAIERLFPHYCFKYGVEGYEFWGSDWLTYNPYEFGWHSYISQSDTPGKSYYVRYPNGDGFLAYPGKPIGHRGPVTSIRLEQAREGMEDYEYLYLLKQRVAKAKAAGRDVSAGERALALEGKLVDMPNAGGRFSTKILPRPDAVLELKEAAAKAIEALPE